MRGPGVVTLAALRGLLPLALAGCASRPNPTPTPPRSDDPCRLVTPAAELLDTFTIALTDSVDLTRPLHPGNDSERLLLRNLFPNLVRLDCQGVLRPGIIQSWTADSKNVWTFTLRENPQFGSGRPMSVYDVAGTLAPGTGPKVSGIDSTRVLSDRELRVFGSRDLDSVLHFLAAPALAMAENLAPESSAAVASLERLARPNLPVIQVWLRTQADARDALDRGADLIVSRDPELIEYARERPEFVTFPLPWNRTYVLLQTASAAPLDVVNTEVQQRSLATEAVHADARAAEPPFWWNEAPECPVGTPAARSPVSDRIAYHRGDPVARALAERLVGLIQSGTSLRTGALDHGPLETALREGTERAYVLGLPRQTMAPCRDLQAIPGGARIRPLIDSRAHAIVRRGAPPLTIEWDGTVRVEEP